MIFHHVKTFVYFVHKTVFMILFSLIVERYMQRRLYDLYCDIIPRSVGRPKGEGGNGCIRSLYVDLFSSFEK